MIMKFKFSVVTILQFLFFFLLGSHAHSEFCHNTANSISELQKNTQDIVHQNEASPFHMACKEPQGLLKDRPKTNLLVRSVIEKDSKGRLTKNLLKKVIHKVRQRIQESEFQIKNIKQCLEQKNEACSELNNWTEVELPNFVSAARFHLSLSQSQHEVKTWVGITSKEVNSKLKTLGSYKLNDWAPLTKTENKKAQTQLEKYQNEIKKTALNKIKSQEICLTCEKSFSDDALLAVRFQHYQTYHQMLSELPLLQYLKGPNVSQKDIESAFAKMQAGLNKEKQQLNEFDKMLKQSPLPTEILKILNYSTQLEETLLEDYQDCALATSLIYTMSNREIGNGLAIGLPLLAASFFAAPAVIAVGGTATIATAASLGTGAIGGGAFVLNSYNQFKETQNRTLGHLYGDNMGSDQQSLDTSSKRLNYDMATLPIGFGLGSLALRSVTVNAKSLLTGRSIYKKENK